jgi:putative heme-binding domain-containing protein
MRLLSVTAASLVLPLLFFAATARPQQKRDPYAAHIAPTPPRSPEDERKAFHLPPGFEAQLVACEPEIRKPINIAFDAAGRLWVTQSTEYPFPAAPGKGHDALKILSDFGPEGRARKITTFADDLNIPIGVLPIGDGALVYSIPNIYRLHESPLTGKADKREVLYATYEFRDTHGMTGEFQWGFDGWVYACHGFANASTIKARDGSSIKMHSGNTYRIKPDGSHIEQWTWGQVNPFGLAFDPLGNLYSCDCHSRPIYQLLRGAYYPSFGKPHDGLGFGPEMLTHDHGSTAIAGIAYYAATHFPGEFRDNIFIGNVVTNRINRDRLERHGSTYKGIAMPDFLASDDPWFRPVDIKLGPDGALWVADFYTRIIGHYEVPLKHPLRTNEHGRIWRIVYRGADGKTAPPPGSQAAADVPTLVRALGDDNLAVRLTATHQLVQRREPGTVEALYKLFIPGDPNPYRRAHSLWVLERLGGAEPLVLGAAAKDPEAVVRVHAMRVLSERKSLRKAERDLVLAGLKDRDAFVQRAAAEALGQHPTAVNLRPLLDLRHTVPAADTHLLHMTRMALRNQLKQAAAWQTVQASKWDEKDARALADVCPGVPSAEAAHFLLGHIQRYAEPRNRLIDYVHHIARYATAPGFDRELVDYLQSAHKADLGLQAACYKAVHHGTQERGAPQAEAVIAWANQLAEGLLQSRSNKELTAGVEIAGLVKSEAMFGLVARLAAAKKGQQANRKAAIAALVAIAPGRAVAPLSRLLADPAVPAPLREQAAASLGATNRPEAQAELLKALAAAPASVETAIATALSGNPPGAAKLLDAVAAGKASARLLQEQAIQVRLRQTKIQGINQRLAKLTRGLPPADQRLQDLIKRRRAAYLASTTKADQGAKVFEKHCAGCHQIANKGARIGPQLDGIGLRGLDRILEDMLDPNRNVDQEFRATTLTLTNGQQVVGLLLREEGAVLVMADAQGKEVRVPRDQVERKTISPLSPMPANFGEQIPEAEFSDLLAYLLAQQVPGVNPRTGDNKRR